MSIYDEERALVDPVLDTGSSLQLLEAKPRRNVGGRLTAEQVNHLIATNKIGMHADGANLYLQVTPRGSASWVFRFALNKRQHKIGLGSARIVPLTAARKLAEAHKLKLVVDTLNPLLARNDTTSQTAVLQKHVEEVTTEFLQLVRSSPL